MKLYSKLYYTSIQTILAFKGKSGQINAKKEKIT